MNKAIERALLLYQQGRYEQAIGELQLQLGQNADDYFVHGLLALCYSDLEKFNEATEHAGRSIHLAPDQSWGHYALARVLADRKRPDEAQVAIEEAIRLDPYDADYFGILASLHLQQHRWREALSAANQGLEIDPEHGNCTNLRAMAQVKLGDRAGAGETIDKALQRRPDDPVTHANQGWKLLEAGQPKQAMEHFREALRLKPDLEWARAGIVEAMKARNFVYRWMLGYFLWMAKLSSQAQWGIIIGLYFAQKVLRNVAQANPAAAPYLQPLLYAYMIFAVMTWIADPLFNLLLRFDRFGRYVLDKDQTRGANALAACLGIAALCCGLGWATGYDQFWLLALVIGLISVPVTAIFRCDEGWPRLAMAGFTALLLLFGLLSAVPMNAFSKDLAPIVDLLAGGSFLLFVLGIVASQFLAIYLMQATAKR